MPVESRVYQQNAGNTLSGSGILLALCGGFCNLRRLGRCVACGHMYAKILPNTLIVGDYSKGIPSVHATVSGTD